MIYGKGKEVLVLEKALKKYQQKITLFFFIVYYCFINVLCILSVPIGCFLKDAAP